jgi:hypothetical protein
LLLVVRQQTYDRTLRRIHYREQQQQENIQFLSALPVFSGLSYPQVATLAYEMETRDFSEEHWLACCGDQIDMVSPCSLIFPLRIKTACFVTSPSRVKLTMFSFVFTLQVFIVLQGSVRVFPDSKTLGCGIEGSLVPIVEAEQPSRRQREGKSLRTKRLQLEPQLQAEELALTPESGRFTMPPIPHMALVQLCRGAVVGEREIQRGAAAFQYHYVAEPNTHVFALQVHCSLFPSEVSYGIPFTPNLEKNTLVLASSLFPHHFPLSSQAHLFATSMPSRGSRFVEYDEVCSISVHIVLCVCAQLMSNPSRLTL